MGNFLSPSYGELNLDAIIKLMITKIKNKPDAQWTIAIGTDSQNKADMTTICSTIMMLEKGKGGI